MVLFMREKHVEQITLLEKRDRHHTINIQKYKVRVETDDQGHPTDALPSDAQTSEYYEMDRLYRRII